MRRSVISAVDHSGNGTLRKPVRVLIANGWSSCHGGSSTSLLDIVKNLDVRKYDPLVTCPEPGDLPRRVEELGVRVLVQRNTALCKERIVPFLCDTLRFVRMLQREGIALVHANVGGSRSALAMAARLSHVPYVQHVRNSLGNGAGSNFGFRWARRIVVNSDATGAPLLQDSRTQGKTVTIHNAVDLSLYDGDDDRRAELGSPDGPILGTVGQLIPRKGIATAIKALEVIHREFPRALLVIVGCAPPGEPEYEAECRELSKSLGLEDRVVFTGYRRDIPQWMRTFDVFVFPTRKEPFGKVVIEAMAAATPVVASHVGGIPEIISEPGLGLLIPPDDHEALSAAVLSLLRDRRNAKEMGFRGSQSVRERFDVGGMVNRLEALYGEVLDTRG